MRMIPRPERHTPFGGLPTGAGLEPARGQVSRAALDEGREQLVPDGEDDRNEQDDTFPERFSEQTRTL